MKALAVLLLAFAGAAHAQRWDFQVFLDDKPIGHHHFALREAGAERELKSEARFDVKLLFITAYRYAHDATERWRGNCLAALTSRTDDGGARVEVSATQQEGRLTIDSGGKREAAEGCVMTFAYWNPEMLGQKRLLNPQTGKIEAVTITAVSDETLTVRGASVAAKRYRITGPKHPIELWYGPDRAWLALQSTVDGGRKLRYQLQ
jgi:hypothetical protein